MYFSLIHFTADNIFVYILIIYKTNHGNNFIFGTREVLIENEGFNMSYYFNFNSANCNYSKRSLSHMGLFSQKKTIIVKKIGQIKMYIDFTIIKKVKREKL